MNHCVSELANTLTTVKVGMEKWLTGIKRKEIAAHLKIYKNISSDTFFTLFATERDAVIQYFKLEHMKYGIIEIIELPNDQGYKDTRIIQTVAL